VKNDVPMTFAAVAEPVAARGWRPFPGMQTSKVPAMCGWSGLNDAEWDCTDLIDTINEYQPADLYCCCLAVQPEIVAIDADIINQEHAAYANELADAILGATPLVRIGFAPKQIRIYRAANLIKSQTRSKSSRVQASLLALAGTRKLIGLISGHMNRRLLLAPTVTLFLR
jgi:hypothetical protein